MKPLNHNNLGVILTFGVPTTVILLGLFWLLRRKRDGDDDDGDAAGTAKVKPLIGDTSEKKEKFTEKALQDGGDSAAQERDGVKKEREESVNFSQDLRKDSQQHRGKQIDGDQRKSELQSDLSALNSIRLESVSPSASPPVSTLLSDQFQSVHRSPAAGEMVAESSPVTFHDILQPSLVSSVTSSIGSAAKSCDSSELSLQSEWSLLGEAETAIIVETSRAEELAVTVTSHGSTANTSTQPSSSQCSLQSDSSGNVRDSKETRGEVTSAECFSQARSSGVSSSSDSFAFIGHSGSDHFAAEEIVPENVSQTRQAPCSSNALPGLNSSQSPDSLSEEAKAAKSKEESEPPTQDDKASLQPASKLEQPSDSCQTSESEQPVVDISESKLPSEEADVIVEEECRSSNVCSLQTAESKRFSSVPSTTADKDSSFSKDDDSTSKASIPGDIRASAPMPTPSTANVEAVESKSVFQEQASASEQGHSTTGTKQNTSESRSTEHHDIVGNQDYSLKEESNKSSSVILPASSTNSNANCSASATDNLEKTTPKKDTSSVSGKKTDSKDTPKTSKNQKNASPQSKSAEPHSKSASPSKTKQSSPPKPANSHSSRNKNQSAPGDGTSESDGVSKAPPGVAENGRMDSGSPICDTNSEASNDSGRGGSVGDTLMPSGGELVRYDFNFPSELCGRLIGRGGKNIQHIKDQSGATVTLSSNPFTPEFQICHVRGTQAEVDRALLMIRKKFPLAHYPRLDMAPLTPPAPQAPVVLPEVMQLSLPEGVSIDVVVSAVVNAGHIFIQQPTHPSFPSLERLNQVMNACYGDPNTPTPSLPRPVDVGIICVSESEGLWFRAQVVQVYPAEDECDVKYVDYGGYNRVPINTLKQIRSDFMTLPFQAVECYLANVTPLQEEEYFSENAAEVLMDLTSGQMLQGQVVGRGDDNVGYVHLYRVSGHKVLMINREMVNREVVRWIEIL